MSCISKAMKKLLVLMSIVLTGLAVPAAAGLYDFNGLMVDVEYSTGSGDNEALLVLTFGIDTYAFLYIWENAATGLDMLQAVDGASSEMAVTYTDDGGSDAVGTISYNGNFGGGSPPDSWWTYFLSTDGESWALQFDSPPHPDNYVLTDGDLNGYGLQTTISGAGTLPELPVIPEPGVAHLLITGGIIAWGCSRKRPYWS